MPDPQWWRLMFSPHRTENHRLWISCRRALQLWQHPISLPARHRPAGNRDQSDSLPSSPPPHPPLTPASPRLHTKLPNASSVHYLFILIMPQRLLLLLLRLLYQPAYGAVMNSFLDLFLIYKCVRVRCCHTPAFARNISSRRAYSWEEPR